MERTCRICDTNDVTPLFEKEGVPYFACRRCGFRFARPATNANLANRIEDFEAAYLDYLRESPRDLRNFHDLLDWAERLGAIRGKTLLDVGSGSGKWVRYLRRQGVEAVGVEPSKALAEHFLPEDWFFNQTIEDFAAQRPAGAFEVVTAFDVIEHVEAPRQVLASIGRLMAPGGRLYLSTPDAASLLARVCGMRWHYFNKYHFSYLSKKNLVSAAQGVGLEPVHFSHRGRRYSLAYLLAYLCEFGLQLRSPAMPRLSHWLVLPVNLYDIMYLCFRKRDSVN